jgi:hypothetical protein
MERKLKANHFCWFKTNIYQNSFLQELRVQAHAILCSSKLDPESHRINTFQVLLISTTVLLLLPYSEHNFSEPP